MLRCYYLDCVLTRLYEVDTLSRLEMAPSSSGLGRCPFKAKTRVRVPLGLFLYIALETHYLSEFFVSGLSVTFFTSATKLNRLARVS